MKLRSALPPRIRQGIVRMAYRLYLRNRLLLVTDGAGWILDSVANSLASNLPSVIRPTVVTGGWGEAHGCTIHFINRVWAWSEEILDTIHPSNRLIGVWWHGNSNLDNPDMQASVERVRRLHHRFVRMQVSCSSGKEALLKLGLPEEKLVTLPEGIDLKRFYPPRSRKDRQLQRARLGLRRDVVAVGCFQKDGQGWSDGTEPKLIKGPDVLADALEQLARHYPICAVIPGPARGYLKRRLTEADVPYVATGFVPAGEIPRYYHALDVYISPSRDEGGPAGVLESMASGVPVVSTRVGMPADMLENGVNGFLVDVEDVDGLASSTAELIERPELRRRIGETGLRTIQPYDWSAIGRRYVEELYRPILDAKQKRAISSSSVSASRNGGGPRLD
ncbi:MAG: glycosyltransferase family 4 protein [Dehalococcoidia bacterium]